jgi:hypothetical protein
VRVLEHEEWVARAQSHAARIDVWVEPHLQRRRDGVAHPVEDFLFTYYSQRPAALRRWHPGFGIALDEADEYLALKGYAGEPVTVTQEYLVSQLPLVGSIHRLLTATAARPPHVGCFGMHEWAMVYRLPTDEVRHSTWPLRLGAAGTDQVVDSHRIACSHFDAFRFFTPDAAPLNNLRPGRDDRAGFEQPGCLHAGMDLYKHAFRLTPLVPSELVADCFELARDIRALDMAASPYDFTALGLEPVRIETPEGKQQYAAAQRRFADQAQPLRARLIDACTALLATTEGFLQVTGG